MTIETTLYTLLSTASGVTSLVSTRIYPLVAPQDAALPYVTYQVVSTEAHNQLSGAAPSERKVVQINCISNTYANAKAIAEAVKTALVNNGYLTGGGDDYFSETQNHRVMLDWSLIG